MTRIGLTSALFFLSFAGHASATPLFNLNSFTQQAGNFFIGIEFQVTTNTAVNQLGIIDANNDHVLSNSTAVAIYSKPAGNSGGVIGTYVTSAVVAAGTAPRSIGVRDAFFTPISTVTLTPGFYVIMSGTGTGGSGEGFGTNNAETYSFLSGTSYKNGWFAGSVTTFPGVGVNVTLSNQANSSSGWPSALFDTAVAASATPEPGTWMLLSAGLALVSAGAFAGRGSAKPRR